MSAVIKRNSGGSPDPNTVLASGTLTLGSLIKGTGSKNVAVASVTELALTGAISDLDALDTFVADLVERVDPQEMDPLANIDFNSIKIATYSPEGDSGQQVGYITIEDLFEAFRFATFNRVNIKPPVSTDNPILQFLYNGGGSDSRYDYQGYQFFTEDENIAASLLLYIEPGQTMTLEGDITATRIGGVSTVETYATCPFGIGHLHRKLDGTLMTDNGIYFYKNPSASNLTFGVGQYTGNYAYFGISGLAGHDFVWDFNVRTLKASSLVVE